MGTLFPFVSAFTLLLLTRLSKFGTDSGGKWLKSHSWGLKGRHYRSSSGFSGTVANHNVTVSHQKIETFFNRCIQHLAKQSLFPKSIKASCDCTLYETTAKFEGCGAVTYKRRVKARGRRKNGEFKEVKVILYGWKVWAICEIETGIPLAIKIDTIEKPDNLHVLAVLEQAKENVAKMLLRKSTHPSLALLNDQLSCDFLSSL